MAARAWSAWVLVCATALSAAAQPKPAGPSFEPGKVTDGTAKNGVTWHVRLPTGWDPQRGGPAILILHGSNMNTSMYVNTIVGAFPKLALDFALIGIDGEHKAEGSTPEAPAFNYSYTSWGGKSKYPGTNDRESPILVTEALAELRTSLKLTKVLVGGHSQGGYLAYSLFMNFPDVFAGAFPISAGLIVQCEPAAYEDATVRTKQRQGALAIVHARDDAVVPFSSGYFAHASFADDGFPALHLFAPTEGAHMFAMLPVEQAVRWLDEMTADHLPALAATLAQRGEAKAWRDVYALSERIKRLDAKRAHARLVEAARKAAEVAATAPAKAVLKAMAAAKDDGWTASFEAFRDDFAFTQAAKPVLAAYDAMREAQTDGAEKLWRDARDAWDKSDNAAARAACAELVRGFPATVQYRWAKNALAR